MIARKNRSMTLRRVPVDPEVTLDDKSLREGLDRYEKWHWGLKARKIIEWKDKDFPDALVECGRLIRVSFRAPQVKHPLRQRDTMIQLSRANSEGCHLTFDPEHKHERLYFCLTPKVRSILKKRFWDDNEFKAISLNRLASIAGGHHDMNDYPDILVKPIGTMATVVYRTSKQSDPPKTFYIHRAGEVTHTYPILCIDAKGRLWAAGGSYTSPDAGITN